VLPELRDGRLVLGVGINADMTSEQLPAQARVPPTSLRLLGGGDVDRVALLADVLEQLEHRYEAFERDGFPGLDRDELRGRVIRLADGTTGVAETVDARGRLVVDGRPFTSAEVERVDAVGGERA
jgi:BirA family transcriptional regulator, biotin operon repressor / biotin---[acetyl-CoA-carboxylase] ligase